jgi:hypothetical protein
LPICGAILVSQLPVSDEQRGAVVFAAEAANKMTNKSNENRTPIDQLIVRCFSRKRLLCARGVFCANWKRFRSTCKQFVAMLHEQ